MSRHKWSKTYPPSKLEKELIESARWKRKTATTVRDIELRRQGMVTVEFAKEEHFDKCVEISKHSPYTKAFESCAVRWGWENNKLLVALKDGEVVGFQFMNITQRGIHTAMYFTCVDSQFHGQGIGGKIFAKVIELSAKAGKEEIQFRVNLENEQTIKFYKGFGMVPTLIDKAGKDYIYRISLRGGQKCLEDFVAVKSRKSRLTRVRRSDALLQLRKYREKGIYTMLGRPDLSQQYTEEERQFITFWGTNQTGKSTIPKALIAESKFVSVHDPFFTLLDHGVVLVSTYPADIRAGGMDSFMGSVPKGENGFQYTQTFLKELWQMRDIKVLVGEGMMMQGRAGVPKRYKENQKLFHRNITYYHCECSIETIAERLLANRGKVYPDDYKKTSDGRTNIERMKEDIERELGKLNDSIITLDAENMDQQEVYAFFKEESGVWE